MYMLIYVCCIYVYRYGIDIYDVVFFLLYIIKWIVFIFIILWVIILFKKIDKGKLVVFVIEEYIVG